MDWKYGTRRDVTSPEELRKELSESSAAYRDSVFREDPHKGVASIVAARRLTGEAEDQSGEGAKSGTRDEVHAQMSAANEAAVAVASAMRGAPRSVLRAMVYGHTVEPWESSDLPGYRPDEVIVVVNRAAPSQPAPVADKPVLDDLNPRGS